MTQTIATTHRLMPRAALAPDELAEMHGLLDAYFRGVSQRQFLGDLREKNWVILIERGGRIVGFSTILAYQTEFEGEPLAVIYSGDTVVAREAWNSSALARGWIESVAALRPLYPSGRFFWLLLTSGFRTYRHLPLFWEEFYPRFDAPTPPATQALIDHLSAERFGPCWDRAAGVVRFAHPQPLRDGLAEIPVSRSADPHIAFFAARNPAHANGDELVCLTELSPGNLTSAGRRMASAVPIW